MNKYRPRRSLLYMPASNQRAIEKAKTLDADCLIFDLEDAVAPEEKISARQSLLAALQASVFGSREIIIRTNSQKSMWFEEDILAAIAAKPDAILIPKISKKSQIIEVDNLIRENNNGISISIWAMIETPKAILEIGNICSASDTAPLEALVLGINDLAKETGAALDLERLPFQYAMSATIIAARAYGVLVFDGVYNEISDLDGLEAQTRQAKQFGFDGKTLIHPNQITICNNIFAPSATEIYEAEKIVQAFEKPENSGKGAIAFEGRMIELLHLEMAKRIVEIGNETLEKDQSK